MYKLCKTERSAARQREMEKGLMQLMMVRRYEDISVSDLCEHLQVPRKSFYRYFSSKDGALNALLDHTMLEYEGFNVVYHRGDHRTLEKELTQFFQFWLKHRDLLDALTKNNMSGNLVERTLSHISTNHIIPERFLANESLYAQKQLTLFCISGLMSMMLSWHKEGFPSSPDQLAIVAARLLSQPLFPNVHTML